MKVFLLENLKGVGEALTTVDVKPGYGNFLIKQKKALDAIKAEAEVKELLHKVALDAELKREDAERHYKILNNLKLIFKELLTPKGTFKKAITKQDIADKLPIKFDKKDILIDSNSGLDQIRVSGSYKISFKCGCGLVATGVVQASELD